MTCTGLGWLTEPEGMAGRYRLQVLRWRQVRRRCRWARTSHAARQTTCDTVSVSATLRLPATAKAPSCVRVALRQTCVELPSDVLDDAQLLSTELVSNVLQHCPMSGTVTVAFACDRGSICVAVTDSSDTDPQPGSPDSAAESGRGLQLLEALASAWGTRPAFIPPGKVVWFRLGPAQPATH